MVEGDEDVDRYNMWGNEEPVSVWQAINAMPEDDWASMARDVFGVDPELLDAHTVLEKIMETRTCTDLRPPVEVWIDEDGVYTIEVYENNKGEGP